MTLFLTNLLYMILFPIEVSLNVLLNLIPLVEVYFTNASYCSIVKVRGQISILCGGSIVFGLSDYPVSEFELVAEELLMSDSIIKASFYSGLWSFKFM